MAIPMSVLVIVNATLNFKNGYKMNVENSTERTSLFQRNSAVL
jgi:hypothetical protein